MGTMLTVTAEGQITLHDEILQHLGIQPGDRLEVDLLPEGKMHLRAKPRQPISRLFGILKRPGQPRLSIEEINDITGAGWSGEK